MNIVEISRKIAEDAHKGQFRKMGADKGKPYIVHPERIAAKFPDDELAVSVGCMMSRKIQMLEWKGLETIPTFHQK